MFILHDIECIIKKDFGSIGLKELREKVKAKISEKLVLNREFAEQYSMKPEGKMARNVINAIQDNMPDIIKLLLNWEYWRKHFNNEDKATIDKTTFLFLLLDSKFSTNTLTEKESKLFEETLIRFSEEKCKKDFASEFDPKFRLKKSVENFSKRIKDETKSPYTKKPDIEALKMNRYVLIYLITFAVWFFRYICWDLKHNNAELISIFNNYRYEKVPQNLKILPPKTFFNAAH